MEFTLGERVVLPYALAPWEPGEVDENLPVLLKVLRGDFLCFPFGGQKVGPPHGASANGEWKIVAGGEEMLHLGLDDPESGAWIEKILTLKDGETAIYCEHRISGAEGDYSYGNHPVIDFSNLTEGEGRVSVSPFRWGSVYHGLFSNPLNREYGALKPHGAFTDLREVPLANGGTTDLTRYPSRQGYEDLAMVMAEPASAEQPFAWSAAVLEGYVWFSLKNPADFPCTIFWISNGGRHGEPWHGRHLGRLGIEEVCSFFADGVDVSRKDPLAADGVPTTREFRKDETVSLRTVQAVAAVPEDFGTVVSIVPAGPGKVKITGDSGKSVETSIDWNFVL
ncbi:hypothetical protein [Luteolibacter luteus]|uniref:DUF4432 family protein n=1 Tax=Luteolibacter luteus TaxID=2728835 RepID=A0A858RMG0_9BACT|nr:hypothetical protein [Luteolibacter luteus]QJE97781.1 hypothetical protein HHL09_19005 [Luteolibacter luteus]